MSIPAGFARLAMATGAVQVALGLGDKPVSAELNASGWTRSDATISTKVRFGPYPEQVRATTVLVWVGGEGPDVLPLTGELGLPPGLPFDFDLTLDVANG